MSKQKSFGSVTVRDTSGAQFVYNFSNRSAFDNFVAYATENSTPKGFAIVDRFFGYSLYSDGDVAIDHLKLLSE